MRRVLAGCILAVVMVSGCSDPGTVNSRADADSLTGSETRSLDQVVFPDVPLDATKPGDALPFDVVPSDLDKETAGPACAPGEGCFLDPCSENDQCDSGWCVEHLGEGVCTQPCSEECPDGWTCKQIAGTDPDVVYVCVSDHANLCKPCASGADCQGTGGVDDVCVDYGDGAFCGGSCSEDADCPWGFSCTKTATVDGLETTQCTADAGVCPCTATSVELGLWTPCTAANEWGQCGGKRLCTEDGLTDCDAPLPMAESCNGLDDDCDGDVDEPDLVEGEFVSLCDDANECTDDACAGEAGCEHESLSEGECKDGDSCTVGDHCEAGLCVGTQIQCDDGNPCTDDSCNGLGGCSFTNNDVACDDNEACTVADHCTEGVCIGVQVDCDCQVDADCAALEDGDLCNGTLVCNLDSFPTACEVDADSLVACPEPEDGADAPCLAAVCDGATGACSFAPAHDGWACDDGDPCTVGESCDAGVCGGGQPANCADGNPCTDETCQPGLGCAYVHNDASCFDGDVCTIGDSCQAGSCAGGVEVMACADNNPCTSDACDPAKGCLFAPVDGPCDDHNACTENDVCSDGLCLPGAIITCDDGNPCTTDTCNVMTGCAYVLNTAPCNDGNACTTNDQCAGGWCTGGESVICDDGNVCNGAESCDEQAGCLPGQPLDCDDNNPCNGEESCEPATGCQVGAAPELSDGIGCTVDSCDPVEGIVHTPNDELCVADAPCVEATCDEEAGCLEETLVDCCGNGEVEAGETCDDGNLEPGDGCDASCQSEQAEPGWLDVGPTGNGHTNAVRLGDDHVVVAYTDNPDRSVEPDHFYLRLLTRSGNTFVMAPPVQLAGSLCKPNNDQGIKLMGALGENHFLMVLQRPDYGDDIVLVKRDGESFSIVQTHETSDTDWWRGHPVDDTHYVLGYREGNSAGPVQYRVVTRSGDSMTLGTPISRPAPGSFPGLSSSEPQTQGALARIGTGVLRELRGGYVYNPGWLATWKLTVNGTSLSTSEPLVYSNSASRTMGPLVAANGQGEIVTLYRSYNDGWYHGCINAAGQYTHKGKLADDSSNWGHQGRDSGDGFINGKFYIRTLPGVIYRFASVCANAEVVETGVPFSGCADAPSVLKSGNFGLFLNCETNGLLRLRYLPL